MKSESDNAGYRPVLRWTALAAIAGNIVFQYLNQEGMNGPSVKEVTDAYPSLVTPAGYAFSIWGLIFLSWLIYGVIQVLPKSRAMPIYDQLAPGVIASSILNSAWLVIYRLEWIAMAEIVIALTLVIAVWLMVTSQRVSNGWLSVPFRLYAGWLSVAVIASTSIWLVSMGMESLGLGPVLWAVLLMVIGTVLGLMVGIGRRDFIYPLIIAWGITAIAVKQFYTHPLLGYGGAACAALLLMGAGLAGMRGKSLTATPN